MHIEDEFILANLNEFYECTEGRFLFFINFMYESVDNLSLITIKRRIGSLTSRNFTYVVFLSGYD